MTKLIPKSKDLVKKQAPAQKSIINEQSSAYAAVQRDDQSSHSKENARTSRRSVASDGNKSMTQGNIDSSLIQNKKTKQILENDRTLLSNRIYMLRKEEDRLMKKIKDTREKANTILEVKQRNEMKFQERQEQEELEKLRVEQERERLKKEKEQRRQEIIATKQQILEDRKRVYSEYRDQRDFAVQYKQKVRINSIKQKRKKRDMVREEELRIQEKLKKRAEEKKKRNQLHYSMRVEDQKQVIGKIDKDIGAMEKEEKEILDRLRNSQKMEQEAYKTLENAIKTSVEGTEWRKQMMSNKVRLPIRKPAKVSDTVSHSSSVYARSQVKK